jgi:peptidoglycan/xylan/chitin deacetylase (PgdA/CDA1 family)
MVEPLAAAAESAPAPPDPAPSASAEPEVDPVEVRRELADRRPHTFGPNTPGVVSRFDTQEDALALTFDLCDGKTDRSFDRALFDLVSREKIPVSVFVSGIWARAHRDLLAEIAAEPLFRVENHGLKHRPCSVNGRGAYGIRGTGNLDLLIDEIQGNADVIREITGRAPRFYRPGTAHLDDVCVAASSRLGETVLGFTVAADGGASYSRGEVREALVRAPSGSIILLHGHRPDGHGREGLADALPKLRARGVKFVRLEDVIQAHP